MDEARSRQDPSARAHDSSASSYKDSTAESIYNSYKDINFAVAEVMDAMLAALEEEEDLAEAHFFNEKKKAANQKLAAQLEELRQTIMEIGASLPAVVGGGAAPSTVSPFEAEVRQCILQYQRTVSMVDELNAVLDSVVAEVEHPRKRQSAEAGYHSGYHHYVAAAAPILAPLDHEAALPAAAAPPRSSGASRLLTQQPKEVMFTCKDGANFFCSHRALKQSLLHDGKQRKYLVAGADPQIMQLIIEFLLDTDQHGEFPPEIPITDDNYSAILQTSVWLKIPSLFVLSVGKVFLSRGGDMTLLYQVVSENFFSSFPPEDCLTLQTVLFSGDNSNNSTLVQGSKAVFDMYWYHRCVMEHELDYKAYAHTRRSWLLALNSFEGESWTQIYSELTIKSVLLAEADSGGSPSRNQKLKKLLGNLVQCMDFTGVASWDRTLAELARWCPGLRVLSVSHTGMRDSTLIRVVDTCHQLRRLYAAGNAMSPSAVTHIKQIYPRVQLMVD